LFTHNILRCFLYTTVRGKKKLKIEFVVLKGKGQLNTVLIVHVEVTPDTQTGQKWNFFSDDFRKNNRRRRNALAWQKPNKKKTTKKTTLLFIKVITR
jgi:hypothetical protein